MSINGSLIKKYEIISKNFKEDTINELIMLIKEDQYSPGEIIHMENTYDKYLYLIKQGEIELFH